MDVEVRRRDDAEWAGALRLVSGRLDFSGVTDPTLRDELETMFREDAELNAPSVAWAVVYWQGSEAKTVYRADRLTPRWLAYAATAVLRAKGIVTRSDTSALADEDEDDV